MGISTTICRSINYFRGNEARADSPRTSHRGLGKLYRKGSAPLRDKIIMNLRHRILSEKITRTEIVALPAELARAALKSCGLEIKAVTVQEVFDVYHSESLCKIANESDNAEILNSLAENPKLNVRGAAAKNPHTPWQTVAEILIRLPKDETQFNYSRYHNMSYYESEYGSGEDPTKNPSYRDEVYSFNRIILAGNILKSHSGDKRYKIMAEVEKRNPEIAREIMKYNLT